ncbi:MAG: VTT domain-containing protein [Phycisphaerales bacterium]|jgi:uncharacterized membrane protein YdjX (TVP38/TMEM64 family)
MHASNPTIAPKTTPPNLHMLPPVPPQAPSKPVAAYVVGAISLICPPLGSLLLLGYINTVADWLRSHGDLGVYYYAGAFAVLAGMALLPTYAQALLGGYVFGFKVGLFAALAGFCGGSIIAYEIARRLHTDHINAKIDAHPRWRAVRDALIGPPDGSRSWWRTLGMVTLIRFPPNSPFAFTNFVLASARVPRSAFLLGTLLGMTPRTALVVFIGAGLTNLEGDHSLFKDFRAMPLWVQIAAIGSIVVTVGVIAYISNRALDKVAKANSPAAPEVDSLL